MGTLVQRSDGAYELTVADKVYLVRFSVGVKELIFQKVVETYAGFLRDGSDEFDPLSSSKKNKLIELYTKYADAKSLDEQKAAREEIDDLVAAMFSDAQAREAATAKVEQQMAAMLSDLHYQVCSVLLTQRDMEGRITEYVSPSRIKFSGEFDQHEKALQELRTKAFDTINETVKKTEKVSEDLAQVLRDGLIPSKMLLRSLQGSTLP